MIYLYTLLNNDIDIATTATGRQHSSVENPRTFQSILDKDTYQHSHPVQWFCFNSTLIQKTYNSCQVTCSKDGPMLAFGCCATYSEDTRLLSVTECLSFQYTGHNVTTPGYILLPRNLTELNDYMCGPLNRKGLVCSECADGFGPSVTSFQYTCANCTDAWYGVPLFLFLEFVPITVFYLIILVFQISVTSAPMPCFIMYAQFIVSMFGLILFDNYSSIRNKLIIKDEDIRLDMKIIHTFYGLFNLDFLHFVIPPFCVSSKLKFFYTAFFGYISAIYPVCLICLTWVCVELHGRNFRPLVCLWRPFHRCFVKLQRAWDAKSDIIDVFTTFFLLSYGKCLYQTVLLLLRQRIMNYDESWQYVDMYYRLTVDLSITFGSTNYLLLVVPSALISFTFVILPPLVLILYPMKAFRLCLSKCRLNFIAVNIFVDKVHGCYRNGLDGGRDMRSFSGLYFFLRILVFLTGQLSSKISKSLNEIWFPMATVCLITAFIVALLKPYKKAYMNYLDTLLLSNLALLGYVVSADFHTLHVTRILFVTPIAMFFGIILVRKFQMLHFNALLKKCPNCCRLSTFFATQRSAEEQQALLIQQI